MGTGHAALPSPALRRTTAATAPGSFSQSFAICVLVIPMDSRFADVSRASTRRGAENEAMRAS